MKTVIEMACEAGFLQEHIWYSKALEQFAELVRMDEREKAMQRCRYYLKHQCLPIIGSDDRTPYHDGVEDTAENIEVSIRDRSNT